MWNGIASPIDFVDISAIFLYSLTIYMWFLFLPRIYMYKAECLCMCVSVFVRVCVSVCVFWPKNCCDLTILNKIIKINIYKIIKNEYLIVILILSNIWIINYKKGSKWTVVFSLKTQNLLAKLLGTGLYLYTWKNVHIYCKSVRSTLSQNNKQK